MSYKPYKLLDATLAPDWELLVMSKIHISSRKKKIKFLMSHIKCVSYMYSYTEYIACNETIPKRIYERVIFLNNLYNVP